MSEDIPRERSRNMVLRQVGWIGQSGQFYPIDGDVSNERAGFAPVYQQAGVWELLTVPGERSHPRYGIKD
jgi:hypothetical protein